MGAVTWILLGRRPDLPPPEATPHLHPMTRSSNQTGGRKNVSNVSHLGGDQKSGSKRSGIMVSAKVI